jgi:hypothetical protein
MSKKSKTTSTTNQQQSLTTTPTNPGWVDSGLGQLGTKVADLSAMDPYSFVAGPDPLLTQAGTGAAGLTTSPNYGQASDIFSKVAGSGANTGTAASLLENLASYMSPYTKDVVDTTLAGFDQNAGYSRARDMLAKGNDSTFGGSGGAIQTALNEQNIGRDRAATEAQLRDQAFTTGAGLSGADAARRQQMSLANMTAADAAQARSLEAARGLTATGQAQGADARANIDTQSSIGQLLQAIAQAKAQAPVSTAAAEAGIWNTLPLNLLHGTNASGTASGTTTGTGTENDPLGQLSKLIAAIGSLGGGGGGGPAAAAAGG